MKTSLKNSKNAIALLVIVFTTLSNLYAQNYKAPAIDASGRITDNHGNYIGTVTTDGHIKDSTGIEIAHVDKDGNLIDHATKKKMGKAEKNGLFVYHFENGKQTILTTSAPMNGTCEIKDSKGNTVLLVHENYKQFGACAYHCLQIQKAHQPMKMK